MHTCLYGNCHNLGSSSFGGYCNADHQQRAPEREMLMEIIQKNPGISTIRDAREFLQRKRDESQAPKTPSPPTTDTKSKSE